MAKNLVRDLHRASRPVFWTDLLLTATAGWGCFVIAVALRPFSAGMLIASVISALLLYRGLCFLHEISHQNQRTLPGFEMAWNLLIGYPLLMPSIVYVGVHQSHHKLSTYGTAQDPEYLPFARSSRMTTVFALEGFFIPLALLVRFLLLSPWTLVSKRFARWAVVHISSLTMNVQYRREATEDLTAKVRRQSTAVLLVWGVVFATAITGFLPWRIFAVWFLVCGLASFVNTMRTLGSHAYESSGEPLDRLGQLVDSIDTPGAPWTEIWAPVGLRYHALHHYFPGIPYHNLPKAYSRLVGTLPIATSYSQLSSPGLRHSLYSLFQKGLQRWWE